MAEVKILIDGKPFDLDDEGLEAIKALKVKRSFNGAEVATAYGDVPIEIDGKPYTMRIGNREWWAAQEFFKVKGVSAIIKCADADEKNLAELYRIALSRHHKDIKITEVGELMDFREEGKPTLRDALERCLSFSRPQTFPDEEQDPKAAAALMAALLAKAATIKQESTAIS